MEEIKEETESEKDRYVEELKKIKEELETIKNAKTKVEVATAKTAVDILLDEWKDKGITKDILESEDFKDIVGVVDKLNNELERVKKEKEELEKNPVLIEAQINEQISELWKENSKEWEEELTQYIPEEMKLLAKSGVKKLAEIEQFIAEEVSIYMKNKLKNGKPIDNPLLAIGVKLVKKINEIAPAKQKTQVDIQKNKKMVSLNSEAPKVTTGVTDVKTNPPGFLDGTIKKLFG